MKTTPNPRATKNNKGELVGLVSPLSLLLSALVATLVVELAVAVDIVRV